MTPEQTVYDRLTASTALAALVEDRVYPSTPTENTQLPFLVYTVTAGDPTLTTTGPSNLTKYTVEVDAWATDLASVLAILGAVKAQLNGWRGGAVQGAFWVSHSTDEQDIGHHGQATYSMWVDQAQVVPPSTPSALITTGPDSITLTACDHTLTLDCDGLTVRDDEDNVLLAIGPGGNVIGGNVVQPGGTLMLGTLTGYMPAYNQAGALAGFIPVYDEIQSMGGGGGGGGSGGGGGGGGG